MTTMRRLITVGVVLAAARSCLAQPATSAPEQTGVNLTGGARLVYQAEKFEPAEGKTPAQAVIDALRSRVDPTGKAGLVWRPVGADRIEILIPRPTTQSTKLHEAYEQVRRQLLAGDTKSVSEFELDHVLRLGPAGRKRPVVIDDRRKGALDLLLEQFPEQAELIGEVVKAHDAWRSAGRPLEDPEDVKRLLARRGVLEFHIAVLHGELEAEKIKDFVGELDKGKLAVGEGRYRWFRAGDRQIARHGFISHVWKGVPYVLVHDAPGKSMPPGQWRIKRAYPIRDEWGSPAVAFELDERGGGGFKELTGKNLDKPLACVLDGEIIMLATIRSAIGELGQITGSFSHEEVKEIARTVQAGALPGALKLISQDQVK